MIDPKIKAAVEGAIGQGLDEWLNDGRDAIRAVLQAIPTLRESLIHKVRDSAEWQQMMEGLDAASDEADAVTGAVGLAKAVLDKLLVAGIGL